MLRLVKLSECRAAVGRLSIEEARQLLILALRAEALPVLFHARHCEQPVAGCAAVESPKKDEPTLSDAATQPRQHLRQLPTKSFRAYEHELASAALQQEKGGVRQRLFAQDIVQWRLEPRDAVEDGHVMRRRAKEIQIQDVEAIDWQFDQRSRMRLR